MKTIARNIAAVFASLLVVFLLLMAVELFSAVVHPFPDDFKGTTEEICQHVTRYPQWVLAVVVPAWAFAAFVGIWIAERIGNLYASAIVGLLVLAALVCNLSMLPYPMWFKLANLLAIPLAIFAGRRLAMRQKTPSSIANN